MHILVMDATFVLIKVIFKGVNTPKVWIILKGFMIIVFLCILMDWLIEINSMVFDIITSPFIRSKQSIILMNHQSYNFVDNITTRTQYYINDRASVPPQYHLILWVDNKYVTKHNLHILFKNLRFLAPGLLVKYIKRCQIVNIQLTLKTIILEDLGISIVDHIKACSFLNLTYCCFCSI